jgi:hypothetical protein
MLQLRIVLVALLTMLVVCAVVEATVTLEPGGEVRAWVSDAISTPKIETYFPTSVPTVRDPAIFDVVDGDSYAKNVIDWSIVGGQTIFSFDTNLYRNGNRLAIASMTTGGLEFVANETAPYELSGYLNVSDVDPSKSGIVEFAARLFDETSPNVLFSNQQKSRDSHAEQFVLGGNGGDRVNVVEGSLKGTLIAGHRYSMNFIANIQTDSIDYPGDADAGASAIGNFTLKIGTVPEPSAVALCSIFAVLGLVRCRHGKSC